MKTVQDISKAGLFFLIVATTFQQVSYAQDFAREKKSSKEAMTRNRVESKDFVFEAQSVSPMGGGMRQLTSSYDLIVSKDTIISNLPYFGRAYTAPVNPSEGGINFTSTNFEYTVKGKRKGGWDV